MWNLNTFIEWFLCIFEIVNQLSFEDNLECPIKRKPESPEETHATKVDSIQTRKDLGSGLEPSSSSYEVSLKWPPVLPCIKVTWNPDPNPPTM